MKQRPELDPIFQFFTNRNWKPFPFQIEAWNAFLEGKSGLLHVPTGSGKTYAAIMGPCARFLAQPRKGLKAIYLTPLRALTRDLEAALLEPLQQESWPLKVESRTGDTTFSKKRKQTLNPSDILLTTPESLSVLISQPEAESVLKNLEVVILDEWHEVLSNKRGSLTELCLSFLRTLNPELQTWALSASIGNLQQAAQAAVGLAEQPLIISGGTARKLDITCLLPEKIDSFPWGGHLGFALRDTLVQELDPSESTLIFTNTRSQAERWYATLIEKKPEMEDLIALHHSSLDREERESVEEGVKTGVLKWVVCTSSLDLGVDFQPVERVVQIGSPKMVARMLQRAGRSAHRPGGKSKMLFVPTNSWEILELEAVKKSLEESQIESRVPLSKPIDVLVQHMTTVACGPGLLLDEFWPAIKNTYSYQNLTREELNWCLQFLTRGGDTLKAYPQYHKLYYDEETGRYHVYPRLAALHRMSIGTIVSKESVQVSYTNRSRIGSVEESFISKLKRGDIFQFAGRRLEFVMIKDMTAYVKAAKAPTNTIPSWDGGRFPISETLSHFFREVLTEGHPQLDPLLKPMMDIQKGISVLPTENTLLIEQLSLKDAECLFVFPFEGRQVHEGLAQLWGLRFARKEPATFSFSINDYGFQLQGPKDYNFHELFDETFFSPENLEREITDSLQIGQLTQRQFREIAKIAGLVFTGFPGSPKSGKQMQISSSLLYDVFKKHEPSNLLMKQSYEEVLTGSLESKRMVTTIERMSKMELKWNQLQRPSPLAFPLLVDLVAGHMSNETLEMKVNRLRKTWETKNANQSPTSQQQSSEQNTKGDSSNLSEVPTPPSRSTAKSTNRGTRGRVQSTSLTTTSTPTTAAVSTEPDAADSAPAPRAHKKTVAKSRSPSKPRSDKSSTSTTKRGAKRPKPASL